MLEVFTLVRLAAVFLEGVLLFFFFFRMAGVIDGEAKSLVSKASNFVKVYEAAGLD